LSLLVRVACHGTVALWIVLVLAWRALAPPLPVELPPLSLEPAPTAAAAPAAALPTPLPVQGADHARGEALLREGGAFPALSFSYQSFPSFGAYAAAMHELGARFVIVQRSSIVGAVDVSAGTLAEASIDAGFSPRARDYSAEPALAPLTRRARRRFGEGAEIMMLVPRRVDAGLFGGLARELASRGRGHASYRELRGRYESGPGGGVRLRVQAAERVDGGREALDLLFDLGAIARAPA
jgi:hypothetical protein